MAEFKNPNQEPGADKRLLLSFAVVAIILFASQSLLQKYQPKPQPKPQEQTQPAPATPSKAVVLPTPQPVAGGRKTTLAPIPAAVIKQASSEADLVIENDLYRITFTNRGAQVKRWLLKKHFDDQGKPLDMVNQRAAAQHGYPLSLFTYDAGLRDKLKAALYVASASGELKAPASITFEFADAETTVRKTFSFDHSYVVKVETSVKQAGSEVAAYPAWPAGIGDQVAGPGFAGSRIDWHTEEKVERKSASSGMLFKEWISNGNTINGPFFWAGTLDQYFAAIFMPDHPTSTALVQFHNTIPRDPDEKDEAKKKKDVFNVLGAAVGNPIGPTSMRLYAGPKTLEILQTVQSYTMNAAPTSAPMGPDLATAVDFGTFGIIAKPLFLWLKWTYEHWVATWGWAIVLLTLIINLALFPLRFTSMKSALKMQKIQPEVAEISRRYQGLKLTDPRQAEKQKEIQELQKREGVNQLGGCLPMLVQMPFLFAFYSMLGAAVELRHAPWLWLKDLSAADPTRVLPVVIIITMFIMQKITPVSGVDPQQARMMQYMMPAMFGLFIWALPSGLGVYILTGNVIGYFLQLAMNNTKSAKEIRAHLDKRTAKKKK